MADDTRRAADARPGDPAEGVRIIGAEEAAEAIERGDVAERRGTNLPRYGDRPARPPAGPKPALRFPLEAGADADTPSLRPAKGQRFDPRPPPAWDEPEVDDEEGDPWPAESTWGEAAWDADEQADVVAWTRGETGAQPVVGAAGAPAEPGLTWAEDFVDEDDPWDGSWDEPTGAVRWADDEVETADAAADPPDAAADPPDAVEGDTERSTDERSDEVADPPVVDLAAPVVDVRDAVASSAPAEPPPVAPAAAGPDADGADAGADDGPADEVADDWAAFGAADDSPRRGRGFLGRFRGGSAEVPVVLPAETPVDPADEVTEVVAAVPPPSEAPAADDASVWGPVVSDDASTDPDSTDPDSTDPDSTDPDSTDPDSTDPDSTDDASTDDGMTDDGAADVGTDDVAPWGEPSWGAEAIDDDDTSARDQSPLFDAEGGWAADEKVFDFGDEPSGQVALPHWTEPGTGELPRILGGDEDAAGPASSGSTPAVHWRSHDRAWGDDGGFDDLSDDDDVRVGALDTERPHEDDLYDFDELDDIGAEPELEPAPVTVPAPRSEGGRRLAPARPIPESDAPTGGSGRNLGVATAVGVGAAVLAIVLLFLGPAFAVGLVVAVLVVGMGEFQAAAQRAGYRPAGLLGLAAAAAYPLAVYWKGVEAYPLLAVLTIGAALAWHLVGADGDARIVESVGVTLFGVAWIAGLGSFAALLLAQEDGRGMLVTAVLAAVGYDVGGLIVGRTMGTRRLSDASPNKTVEGLVGGMVMSLFVVGVVAGLFGLAPWDGGDALKIGVLAMLFAPLGDLCESLIKRDLGVKDMGNLLPEHGGILDRFDALLFVLPAVFYAAMAWGIAPF